MFRAGPGGRLGVLVCTGVLLMHASAPPARADASADARKALLAVRDADPLELARIVQRFRDAAILALLAPTQPTAVRIAAMRASPWLSQPELALPALATCIDNRDSELAEAAVRAAFAIASKLDADSLARRESDRAELAAVASRLHALRPKAWLRADLVSLAGATAAQLDALSSTTR